MNIMVPTHGMLAAGLEPYPGWRLTQFIGRGGFSEVWKAELHDGRALALKFTPVDDRGMAAREIRALQLVRQLAHPQLVAVERIWVYGGYIVIAMELADGSLLDLLEAYQEELGSPLPAEQVCLYLLQAAEVIDFLNSRRHQVNGQQLAIQHCDIKPSNLLLFGDTVKLADFGLASTTTGRLDHHRRAGTTAYSAPEVFQGRLSDRADQYALAVSYCQLRTGQAPFPEIEGRVPRGYRPPPPDLSGLSEGEQSVVTRGLNPVPQNRWGSCTEMMNQLAALLT